MFNFDESQIEDFEMAHRRSLEPNNEILNNLVENSRLMENFEDELE